MRVTYNLFVTHTNLSVNGQGRVTIPAQLRRELGIEPGSSITAYVDDGRLILEPRTHLVARDARIQRPARTSGTGRGSMVDELIAERGAEATRERTETAARRRTVWCWWPRWCWPLSTPKRVLRR